MKYRLLSMLLVMAVCACRPDPAKVAAERDAAREQLRGILLNDKETYDGDEVIKVLKKASFNNGDLLSDYKGIFELPGARFEAHGEPRYYWSIKVKKPPAPDPTHIAVS